MCSPLATMILQGIFLYRSKEMDRVRSLKLVLHSLPSLSLLKLNAVFANTGWWEGLDQADREYLAQEITAMCREADQGCWKLEESILDQMEASDSIELHRLTDEERQQFVTVGESLWSRFDGVIDRELLTRIQDEIAKRK